MAKGSNKASDEATRECVAQYLAEGLFPIEGKDSISSRCDVSKVSIYAWKKQPEFAARVEELRQAAKDAVAELFIAQRSNRMALYNKQALSLLRLKEARAKAHADDPELVGGDTGNVVKKKTVRRETTDHRKNVTVDIVTVEVAYDAAVDRELRELAKQAAIEMGEWSEKRELTGAGGTPLIPIRELVIDRSAENMPRE